MKLNVLELQNYFDQFGETLKVTLKSASDSCTATIEYFRVASAVEAVKVLTRKSPINLSECLSLELCEPKPSNCILLHRVDRSIDIDVLRQQCSLFGDYRQFDEDSEGGCLVRYDTTQRAQNVAVYLKGIYGGNRMKMSIDFASPECVDRFGLRSWSSDLESLMPKKRLCLGCRSPKEAVMDEETNGLGGMESSGETSRESNEGSNVQSRVKVDNVTLQNRMSSPMPNDSAGHQSSPTSTNLIQEFKSTANLSSFSCDFQDEILNCSLESISIEELFFG